MGTSARPPSLQRAGRMRAELEAIRRVRHAGRPSAGSPSARPRCASRSSNCRRDPRGRSSAIGEADDGAFSPPPVGRPEIEWAQQAAVEAPARLEAGAGAIEEQHDRLAALLAGGRYGVGGAERKRRACPASAQRRRRGLPSVGETGPALVAALVQVKEAAAHAAERAREAISAVIPESAGQLSDATRDALEQVVRDERRRPAARGRDDRRPRRRGRARRVRAADAADDQHRPERRGARSASGGDAAKQRASRTARPSPSACRC